MRPQSQSVASNLKALLRHVLGLLAKGRQSYALISAILFALPSFWPVNPPWLKWTLFGLGALFLAGYYLFENLVHKAQLNDLTRLNAFAEIHAGCLELIAEGEYALRVENNAHKARSKLEQAQQGLLQLFADGSIFLENLDPNSATANLMVPTDSRNLKLVKFSSRRGGRGEGVRKLSVHNNLPGASKAFLTCQTQYVSDTHSYDSVIFDHTRPYRSILSIPVISPSSPDLCLGIVNVDNGKVDAFKNHALVVALSKDWLSSLSLTITLHQAAQRQFD